MRKGKDCRVLIVAPHLDDEVLGCGGAIGRHVTLGNRVEVCFVAHRIYDHIYCENKMNVELEHAKIVQKHLGYTAFNFLNLPDERLDTCLQDIIIPLEKAVKEFKPEIVYSPYAFDNNQDHRAVARAVQVVLRPASSPFLRKWLVYETPSCTEQAPNIGYPPPFSPNFYLDISSFITDKVNAMALYETEDRIYPHPRSPEGIKVLAMKRGMEAGLEFAEAFMLLRQKA